MQKFFRGHRVKIDDEMPQFMDHFESGKEAIVQYSCSDAYGGNDTAQYSLLILEPKPHSVSWYYETQLTFVDGDRDAGEKILQGYKNH